MARTVKKKITMIVSTVIVAILVVALIIGNIACFSWYPNIITQYLCGFGLDENSEASVAARESGNELAEQVEAEGAVLLKNDGVLPLKKDSEGKIKVNVFGWAGSDAGFIPQGTGSGTGSRNDLVTFLGGLKEAGITANPDLVSAYDDLNLERVRGTSGNYVIEAYTDDLYRSYYGVIEAPESFYSDSLMTSAKSYSDTAIVVLGRLLGEGNDYSKIQYIQDGVDDASRKLQGLSVREEYMLEQVTKNFSKVVVVFNTTNPMEAGFLDNEKIGAALFMGVPGTRGTIGLAKLLTGEITPSGHLTDTWAYDLSTAASYANSAREGVGSYLDISADSSLGTRANKYSEYVEDIYIGYKWYETADAENFWASNFAREKWGIENGYEDVVQYPFGYGLSYTQFRWTITEVSLDDGATLAKDGKLTFKIAVENIGEVAGKDVVQVYYSTPYTEGGIEKSAITLGAFAKTALLEPGRAEILTLELPVEDMKSYDCYDRNNNGYMGYELEGGEYTISFRTDAHTLAVTGNADGRNSYTYEVPTEGYRYETDSTTGTKVENQFTNYTNTTSGASSAINEQAVRNAHSIDGSDEPDAIVYMTRANFADTFPEDVDYVNGERHTKNAGQLKDDTLYVTHDPVNDDADEAPVFGSKETSWTLSDIVGVKYDDPMWDELVSQLSLDTMGRLIVQAGFGTIGIDSIGKPKTVDADGPTGFNNSVTGDGGLKAVCYPGGAILASTWDWYTSYQVGRAVGIEAKALGISGWYGPGANLHRSPMSGRNFEYYSEDARLSGIMCAYEVYGAKEQGLMAYVKHIAVNDSESGRNGAYKWLTEQNLRENYLLTYEIIVKVGKSNAMMSSVDRVGSTRASASYAMLTTVLRDEWGFRGTVITDYYQNAKVGGGAGEASDTVHDVDECVRAGNSQILYTDGSIRYFNDSSSNTAKKAIFKSAKDILYAYVDTLDFAANAQGLDKESMIGESVEVFEWWRPALIAIDVAAGGLMAFWLFLAYRKGKKDA